ncbi:MAG: MarR family transcriptional regulator [Candidatus Moraniibacteriota bacterium]
MATQLQAPESNTASEKWTVDYVSALVHFRMFQVSLIRSESIPNLTQRQLALLFIVYSVPVRLCVHELAKQMGVQKPIISRALSSLEQLGLVKRVRDSHDKRNVFVSSTETGRTYCYKFLTLWMAYFDM